VTHFLQQHLVNEHTLDLRQLCIVPGKHCWLARVDVLVFNADGAVIDACMVAACVALRSLKVRLQSVNLLSTVQVLSNNIIANLMSRQCHKLARLCTQGLKVITVIQLMR
jgi:exosome complex RNA-binding protein Rrp42 (RNase PH superfamily)